MSNLTITLPDALRQRTEQIARQEGSTIDALILRLLEEYLEEIEDIQDVRAIQERIAAGVEQTIPHSDVWRDDIKSED